MARLCLLTLPVLANSCSISGLISSSTEHKRGAYQSHRDQWKLAGAPAQFGRERSVQLFEGDKVRVTEDQISVTGNLGMAALISADGYALTAAHVVGGLRRMDTVLHLNPSRRAPVHAQWTPFTTRDRLGHLKSRSERVELFFYGASVNLIGSRQIGVGKIRVVKSFPSRDLAILKLPVKTNRWFELPPAPPPPGAVLFASGNGATPYQGPSAGEVVAIKRPKDAVQTIETSIPLASGDSGGPAFDASGRLVGIISHVLPSRIFPPKLNHSSLRMMDPGESHRLIRHDRARLSAPDPE